MFGWFKRKKGEGVPATADEEPLGAALGWEALESAFEQLYPNQKPRHWTHNGVMRMHDLRNPPENPFDGVNIYDGGTFWHYVSLGLSDLYDRVSDDEWSGFGYELTFRLAKREESDPPLWPINVMGSLARAAFTGSVFVAGDTVDMGPLDGQRTSGLTGVLIARDPGFQLLDTPTGKLELLLLLGVTSETRVRAQTLGSDALLAELRAHNPELVTRS